MCICVYVYMCICVYVYMCTCVYVYMCTCVYVYMCICVYVYMCICVYVYMCICVYVYIHNLYQKTVFMRGFSRNYEDLIMRMTKREPTDRIGFSIDLQLKWDELYGHAWFLE